MKTSPLGSVCDVTMGQAPPGSSYNLNGQGMPLVAGAGDFGLLKPSPQKYTTSPTRITDEGDIILCIRATIGDLNWSDRQYCLGRGVAGLRPHSDALDHKYIWYWLLSSRDDLAKQARGSTFKQVAREAIEFLNVPLPPLPEQRRIAAILDKADAIRRKRQEAIKLTEEFLRSVFLDMFGDPVTNPKGWDTFKLGNHLKFVTSGSRGWAKYYSDSGPRFIRSLDVQMNFISDEEVVYVSPPRGAETERTRVLEGDVLLTITGSRIGRVAPVAAGIGEAYVSQHVAILRLDDRFLPRFVSMFLSHPRGGQHQIRKMQYGQTKPGLNLEQVRGFELIAPPKAEQQHFDGIWDRFIRHLDNQHEALYSSSSLFESITSSVFSGGV